MRDLTLNEVEEVNGGNDNLTTAEAYFDWASYYRIYYQTRREQAYIHRFNPHSWVNFAA
ncbi:MAG: hypothetical protein GY822_05195 [Deltaproteobacteria bacterium]|nr:hypothetical protein [Deltaproteobacteria bacterium]